MTKVGLDNQWPGPDDRLVATEMLNNPDSPHWEKCRNFIHGLIQVSSLPVDFREDAVQNAMLAVMKSLRDFRYECRLRTWLGIIVHTRAIDMYRDIKRDSQRSAQTNAQPEKLGHETDHLDLEINTLPLTPEEIYLIREELSEVLTKLQAYTNAHRHPRRNSIILQKVLLENCSCEDVAQQLGVSSAMVSYIVRAARRYLREKREH